MEQDVIVSEVSDSELELGPIAIPRRNRTSAEKTQVVRQGQPLFSFRQLRSKKFSQRHVYTVDLSNFLGLESEKNLERLASTSSDEEVMHHLNQIYLHKKDRYDKLGFKRHKFTKPTFQIYVEDFKKYESTRLGKSFYDTIEDGNEMPKLRPLSKEKTPEIKSTTPDKDKHSKSVDHLIPVLKKPVHTYKERVSRKHTVPVVPDLESDEDSEKVNEITEHENIEQVEDSEKVENNEIIEEVQDSMGQDIPLHISQLPQSPQSQSPIQEIPLPPIEYSRRSLRERKFSQNHVYTVDLCAYLGLLTRTELDSYSASGISDESIFQKLDKLYEEQRIRNPRLKLNKFKFSNFLSHLEHHTKKYQKQIEISNQQETFSSQLESSSEDEHSSSDEENTMYEQRKRLKGVLPFSYLKMQGALAHNSPKPRQLVYNNNHLGVAKRKKRKLPHRVDTLDDFIDDNETMELDITPIQLDITPIEHMEISDDSTSEEQDSDMDMRFPSTSSDLFGLAEEDRSSGIDYMLNRSTGKLKTYTKSAKPKRTQHSGGSSRNVSTWSTDSKRIYRRRGKSMVQPRIPYLHNATPKTRPLLESNQKEPSTPIQEILPLKPKKKPKNFYGVAPNLSMHALSRAPQSYTPQFEAVNHKYSMVKSKNLSSKENLHPLEPMGIYEIPQSDSDVEIIDNFDPIDKFQYLHDLHKSELDEIRDKMSLTSDTTEIVIFKLNDSQITISKLNLNESIKLKKFMNIFKNYLTSNHILKNDNEKLVFLQQLTQWLINIKDISPQYTINIIDELLLITEILVNHNMRHIVDSRQSGKFSIVLISQLILNISIGYKVLSNHSISQKIINAIETLTRSYFTYISLCEPLDSFINLLDDPIYYKSLLIIGLLNTYTPIKTWPEFTYSLSKSNSKIEYINLYRTFTQERDWKPVNYLIRSTKKLTGSLQTKTLRRAIELVSELGWDLDESVIVTIYDLISHLKFDNFPHEVGNFILQDFDNLSSESIINMYYKLLIRYISMTRSNSIIEKIMPISSVDSNTSDTILINRINLLLIYSNFFKNNFQKQLNVLFKHTLDSEKRLDIAFDAYCLLIDINLTNGLKISVESIIDIVRRYVINFNSILGKDLSNVAIGYKICQKIIGKIIEFNSIDQIPKIDIWKLICEILKIKFHATSVLDNLLVDVISLLQHCLTETHKLINYIHENVYQLLTNTVGLQLTIFISNNPHLVNKLTRIVTTWCEFSQWLISHKMMTWNEVVNYHWNNMAGISQREFFELILLNFIIDDNSMKDSIMFLKLFSKNIVKFGNDDIILKYLEKLIRLYQYDRIIFANSFDLTSNRTQIVISYIYYLKKLSEDNSKESELLFYEMFKSMETELESPNMEYNHFAVKIINYINYSCSSIVKNVREFSQLRDHLKISHYSSFDNENFLKLFQRTHAPYKLIEAEFQSCFIQGHEADLKFTKILQDMIISQLNNEFEINNQSPLSVITTLISSHIQIINNQNGVYHWYMINKYSEILINCILQNKTLSPVDMKCVIEMIPYMTLLNYCQYHDEVLTKCRISILTTHYQILIIIYNLLSGYTDQLNFIQLMQLIPRSINKITLPNTTQVQECMIFLQRLNHNNDQYILRQCKLLRDDELNLKFVQNSFIKLINGDNYITTDMISW